jgi:hypothetical protein
MCGGSHVIFIKASFVWSVIYVKLKLKFMDRNENMTQNRDLIAIYSSHLSRFSMWWTTHKIQEKKFG